jgi:WD40 repeat protein
VLLPLLALILGSLQATPPLESRAQALSADERLFAYAVTDGTVRIATLPAGKVRVLVSGFSQAVEGLAFSPDGSRLASVAQDGSIQIISSADGGLEVSCAVAPTLPVRWCSATVHFVDNGSKLLVAGGRLFARLLDASDGHLVRELQLDPRSSTSAVSVSADSRHFTLADSGGRFAVFDANSGAITFGPRQGLRVQSLALDGDAGQLAVGTIDCNALVYSLGSQAEPTVLSHCTEDLVEPGIRDVSFSSDGKQLLTTTSGARVVRLWKLATRTIEWSYDYGVEGGVELTARFVPASDRVLASVLGAVLDRANGRARAYLGFGEFQSAGSYAWRILEGDLVLYDAKKNLAVCWLPIRPRPPAPPIRSIAQALSSDGKLFAYAVTDGSVHIVKLPDGKARAIAGGLPVDLDGLAFSPDDRELATVAHDGSVRILACADGKLLGSYASDHERLSDEWRLRSIEYVDDGTKLLLAGEAPKARLIEREDGARVRELTLGARRDVDDDGPTISASAVSLDRKHFALGDRAGRYAVLSARSGAIEFGPREGPKWVHSVDFDPAVEHLAIGAGDCTARVVSLWKKAASLELSHCDQDWSGDLAIGFVRFGPDGKTLLSTSFDFWEVRLWDLEHKRLVWQYDFSGGNPAPIAAYLTPDRTRVLVSPDGTLLDAKSGKALHQLCVPTDYRWYQSADGYAWTQSSSAIQLVDPGTGKTVCELPLVTGK